MSTMPVEAVQRKAAYVPPKSTFPLMMLAPTTTEPSAETPHASLWNDPPGRSPSPVRVGWARADAAPAATVRAAAVKMRDERRSVCGDFMGLPTYHTGEIQQRVFTPGITP